MSADVVAAVVERLESHTGLRVHDADPSSPVYPYIVVYADGGIRSSNRAADVRVQQLVGWQTTTVGVNAGQVREARDRVTDALEDWTPDVVGRACHKVEHPTSRNVAKDDTLPDRVVFYGVDQWSVSSSPHVG